MDETVKREFALSIAVPIHNEEQNLPELIRRIGNVLDGVSGGPHQILIVDDGSWDRSPQLLKAAAQTDSRLTVVVLSRNFGHQAALSAALDHITGDAVVLMDGDLQDAPEAIPGFLEKFKQGYDVVYATRAASRKEGLALRFCYSLFYRLQSALSNISLPIDSGDFGLMSRRVVDQMRQMREHHRYLRGLRSWVGFRQVGIPIERAERGAGKSKYGFFRLLKLAFDGIFAFSVWPLRAATLVGATAAGLSGIFALYSIYAKIVLHKSPQGFTALVLLISFLSGVLLFFQGIIGEYLGRVYEELKGRPIYVVDEIINHSASIAQNPPKRLDSRNKQIDG